MVPNGDEYGDYQQSIPILEKFSHLGNAHMIEENPDNLNASSAAPSHEEGSYNL